MNILLVDDHAIFREGTRKILQEEFPSATIHEGSTAEDAVEKATRSDYDIVICDLSMPGRTGLDVVKQLKIIKDELPILILSMHPEEQFAIRAMKAGASGFVQKNCDSKTLIAAVHRIIQGRNYLSEEVMDKLSENLHGKEKNYSHEDLSDREFTVFKLIAEGKSMTEISKQLFLSLSTISTHKYRILAKLNLKTSADIVKYSIEHNLICFFRSN